MNKDTENDKSICTLKSTKKTNKRDTIPYRIEFIKDLMEGQNITPLIDVEESESDSSGESFDTRYKLKKRNLNFRSFISGLGGRLDYIKSGTTGQVFHGMVGEDLNNPDYEFGLKVSAFQKKAKYGDVYDSRRPENAEVLMIKTLSKLIIDEQTPHIVLPICTFDTNINNFVNLMEDGYVEKDNKKYKEFIEKHKRGELYDTVSILISEWANRGDFLDYVRKNYTYFSPIHWKVFFFQIISALAVIQSQYPSFRHNDLKANNILIHKGTNQDKKHYNYRVVRTMYKVPNIGYTLKIWDFDFACIPGTVDNQKVNKSWTKAINVTPDSNRYYDLHYFFNTFIKKGFFPQFMTEDCIPQEAKDFVMRVVPKKFQRGKFVHERGRILINHVFITPDELLKTDPYFAEFRRETKSKSRSSKRHTRKVVDNESESHSHIKRLLEGSGDIYDVSNIEISHVKRKKRRKTKTKTRKKRRGGRTKSKDSKRKGSKRTSRKGSKRKSRRERTRSKTTKKKGKKSKKDKKDKKGNKSEKRQVVKKVA